MSIAIPVHGGTMKWNTTTTTYMSITEAKRLIFPKFNREFTDVTSLDSVDGIREFVPNLADPGELVIACNYSNAIFNTAHGYFTGKTLVYFQTTINLQDTETVAANWAFQGYVSPEVADGEIDGTLELMLNIRCTGAATFTNGS
ncbi:hypothetical protein [Jannaschia formosa]|uniref:hypothetical protein n=1 Tax=Jannaschia formosa TaxID=2259592 RepID=UPI000E1C0635|nr:hypothetical protein [Jannaschia formosa]TFL16437.1 hypothetical protein DR046_20160 [Jannaschia formosa]